MQLSGQNLSKLWVWQFQLVKLATGKKDLRCTSKPTTHPSPQFQTQHGHKSIKASSSTSISGGAHVLNVSPSRAEENQVDHQWNPRQEQRYRAVVASPSPPKKVEMRRRQIRLSPSISPPASKDSGKEIKIPTLPVPSQHLVVPPRHLLPAVDRGVRMECAGSAR